MQPGEQQLQQYQYDSHVFNLRVTDKRGKHHPQKTRGYLATCRIRAHDWASSDQTCCTAWRPWLDRMRRSRLGLLPPARHRGTGARCGPSITYLRVRQPQSFLATHLVALPAGTIAVSCVSAGSLQRPNNGHIVHHSHQRRSLRTVHPLPQSYVIHAPCCSVYDACGQNVSCVNLIILTSHCMQATATVYSWIKMLSGYQPHHHFVITRSMIWTCKFLASKHLKTEEIRIYCELQYKTV